MNAVTEPETTAPLASFRADWQRAGFLPPEGTPITPAPPFDVGAALQAQRLARFKEKCPDEFRQAINRTKLPNLDAWDKADAWTGGHPGLWLWSHATGRGKTRMAWRHFGRLHVEHGKTVIKGTGQSLAEEYFAAHMDGAPRDFYRWISRADVLVIDDVDKMDTANPRTVRMLRELFDELYANRRSVIVTSNEPISYFATVAGESCARRMREVCTEIEF